MYRSPIEITQIQEDLKVTFEDGVFKAIRRVGINVDKEDCSKHWRTTGGNTNRDIVTH